MPGRGLEAHVTGRDGEGLDVDEAGVIVEDAGDAAGTLTVFAVGKRHIVSLEIPPARAGDADRYMSRRGYSFLHGLSSIRTGRPAQEDTGQR